MGHTATVAATQLCCCSAKAAIVTTGCIQVKLHLQKQVADRFGPADPETVLTLAFYKLRIRLTSLKDCFNKKQEKEYTRHYLWSTKPDVFYF